MRSCGKYTYGQENIHIIQQQGKAAMLEIGNFCSIAGNVSVFLGGNHRIDWITTYPFGHIHTDIFNNFSGEGHPQTKGDVIIENDVWIGNNAVILSGVTIGNGAVVGAYALVSKNVEPYSVVVGNPARHVKYRFDSRTISQLLKIQWWNWDDAKINSEISLLCSSPDSFINKHEISD